MSCCQLSHNKAINNISEKTKKGKKNGNEMGQNQRAFQFYSDKHMPKHNLRLKTKFC